MFAVLLVGLAWMAIAACVPEQVPRDATPSPTISGSTSVQTSTPTPTAPQSPTAPPTTPTPTADSLFLDVRGPSDGAVVGNAAVVIHGLTLPGATVSIGSWAEVAGADGRFQAEVALEPGDNEIVVVAKDTRTGTQISAQVTVRFEEPPGQPFFLVVTEPSDQSIVSTSRLSVVGKTSPGAVVTVNDVGVSVGEAGDFSTVITLEQGPNIIEVVASGLQGRVLSAVIAVIYRP